MKRRRAEASLISPATWQGAVGAGGSREGDEAAGSRGAGRAARREPSGLRRSGRRAAAPPCRPPPAPHPLHAQLGALQLVDLAVHLHQRAARHVRGLLSHLQAGRPSGGGEKAAADLATSRRRGPGCGAGARCCTPERSGKHEARQGPRAAPAALVLRHSLCRGARPCPPPAAAAPWRPGRGCPPPHRPPRGAGPAATRRPSWRAAGGSETCSRVSGLVEKRHSVAERPGSSAQPGAAGSAANQAVDPCRRRFFAAHQGRPCPSTGMKT